MKIKITQDIIDILRGKKIICVNVKKPTKPVEKLRPLVKKYNPPTHTYKYPIVTQGFGHSGTGVIIDLLSEFDNTTVLGYRDKNGGSPLANDPNTFKIELDFARRYGGVLDLEKAFAPLSDNSMFYLFNFITLSEFYYSQRDSKGILYNDKYMELTNEFIEKLINKKAELDFPIAGNDAFAFKEHISGKDYSNLQTPYSYKNKKIRYRYYLKDLTLNEYRKLAKEYINNVLSILDSKDYLVLDQFLNYGTFEFDKYNEYIENYKMVSVYRDPRDVYMTGILLNENWIPRKKEDFVAWYESPNIPKYINANHPNVMTVRFEDLVLDYDNTIPKVIEFLGLKKENHIAPKTQFRPEISKNNIGLWKNFEDQDAINYIYNELREFCYEKEVK